jgi:hypothetical protein
MYEREQTRKTYAIAYALIPEHGNHDNGSEDRQHDMTEPLIDSWIFVPKVCLEIP